MIACWGCNKKQPPNNAFCVYCGVKLAIENPVSRFATQDQCVRCGVELVQGNNFCTACGAARTIPSEQEEHGPPIDKHRKKSKPSPGVSAFRFWERWSGERLRSRVKPPKPRRVDRTTIIAAIFLIVFFVSVLFGLPNQLVSNTETGASNNQVLDACETVRDVYPGGLGTSAAVNVGGFVEIPWHVDNARFEEFLDLDSDGDGIACETDYPTYQSLPCEYKVTNLERVNSMVARISESLAVVSSKFADLEKVSAQGAWDARNEFEGLYQELEEIQRPYSAFALEQTSEALRGYFNNWERLSKAYSGGNQSGIQEALEALKNDQETLDRTIQVAQGLENGLLPSC